MTYTGLPQTQRGIVERLRACAELTAIVGANGIYDAVPLSATKPYLVYESATETPNDTFGQRGHSIDVSVDIYTDDGSQSRSGRGTAGYITNAEIAEIVMRELLDDDTPLVIDGHDVVDLVHIGNRETRTNDKVDTRLLEVAFTAEIEDDIAL